MDRPTGKAGFLGLIARGFGTRSQIMRSAIMATENTARRWFALTRDRMPGLAQQRAWPVDQDHCFQRILLDNAVGEKWTTGIPAPAYRNAPDEVLERAIALGEAAIAGREDMAELNRNSLAWRGTGENSGSGATA